MIEFLLAVIVAAGGALWFAHSRIRELEEEVDILHRYRVACHEAERWLTPTVNGSEVAQWLRAVGEGEEVPSVEAFRETLVKRGKV